MYFYNGASGLSWLRDAMAIGAVTCAAVIAHRPPLQKAGKTMLWSVAIFGVATILFGLANNNCLGRWVAWPNTFWFWFAFAMLALAHVVDQIKVVVRQTLVQILTPDEKHERVSAVQQPLHRHSNSAASVPVSQPGYSPPRHFSATGKRPARSSPPLPAAWVRLW